MKQVSTSRVSIWSSCFGPKLLVFPTVWNPNVWIFLMPLKCRTAVYKCHTKLWPVYRANCEPHNLIRELARPVGGVPVRRRCIRNFPAFANQLARVHLVLLNWLMGSVDSDNKQPRRCSRGCRLGPMTQSTSHTLSKLWPERQVSVY